MGPGTGVGMDLATTISPSAPLRETVSAFIATFATVGALTSGSLLGLRLDAFCVRLGFGRDLAMWSRAGE